MLNKIRQFSDFSNSEKALADYILDHPEAIAAMNIRELAQESYTSTATITRFMKKLGIENYNDLRMQIAFSYKEQQANGPGPNADTPFLQTDSMEEVADKLARLSINSIKNTRGNINFNQMRRIIRCIAKSTCIDCFGEGDSLLSVMDFKQRMMRLNKLVLIEQEFSAQAHQAYNADKTHCALIISHSGQKKNPIKIAKILKKNQVPIILITAEEHSVLAEMANYCLFTDKNETEKLIDKLTTFSSQIAVHYILDCMYSFYYLENYEKNRAYSLECENTVEGVCHTFYTSDYDDY